MASLHIALQEGFRGHLVVITVDGREVYRKSFVTTNLAISRADAVDVDLGSEKARVEVATTPGGKAALDVNATESPYLSVSLEGDGKITFQKSKEPVRYM